ncbi:ImmA/IrrE family metallo-endopeptidase [Actinomycetospora endophytica]|uniref:ImmA/IrrE family metallo-endopeptidase n=1 Tax=Actinomycetospora endophytica TaxID=2291215 RepID=A0ABS8PHF5_9PSEU|nr:ImmA/IrrE family metallo-endopeptidase [Actinomycetospora endophytica]MCD2197693.1 ImmA/IrrE family metallo-endopeptidase [Actinomycetospora endophytica]
MSSTMNFDARRSPEVTADDVLDQLGVDELGGLPLPVDPVALARWLGAEVFTMDLEDDVSAMLVGEAGRPPTIYLNARETSERRRFSCAHEIGHLLRRRTSGVTDFGFVDRRNHLSETGTDREERWANRFAAALLMPTVFLRGVPPEQRRHPERLAPVFGVSPTAMRIRLENLGLPR